MFIRAETQSDCRIIAKLASEIWQQHYISILEVKQIEYMLEKFQIPSAIAEEIKSSSIDYYLIKIDKRYSGYFAIKRKKDELFLSKLYIRQSERGKGYARLALNFIEKICKENSLTRITLTVHKRNMNSISAYQRMGFVKISPVVTDIGNGFVMDDYILVKKLCRD